MPALTDKIFLPISIFVLNVALAAFKFVLASAVGACFAIYAMRGCEYAKSVGWIRSSGYLEMIKTSFNTFKRKNVPGSVKWALIVAFIVTLVANFLDKGIASFVSPGFRRGQPKEDLVISRQASHIWMFFGWNFVVPGNGSVVGTMERALNSSIANPSPDDGYVYSPVISDYTPVCTDFGLHFQDEIMRNGTGCLVEIFFPSRLNRTYIKTERSSNRWSMIMATIPMESARLINGQPVVGLLHFMDPNSLKSKKDDAFYFPENYRDGYRYPKTSITKYVHYNGDITVIAMTTTRVSGSLDEYDLEVAKTYSTYHSDDLLSTMNEIIRTNSTPSPLGQGWQNLMAEIRVANSTVEAFVCTVYYEEVLDMDWFLCVYVTMTMHVFNQPVHNSQIQLLIERLKGGQHFVHYMVLEYFPELSKDNTPAAISTKKMRDDTVAVADYMTRTRSSFLVDFNENKVYILYDKAEVKTGLEIPLWVLIAAGIIMLVSLCVWQLTHWFVGPPHTSSLYSIVRTQLAERSVTPFPRLMRFKLPLMFEDVDLLPDKVEHLPDETGTLPEDIKSA
ncbi:MAG: hypothetical protein J3Q66DRAFT_439574 [Benniella sp.]|nr:MAG: hypothetical protein J3Q66DRAFT_439574 [Benniella sp.]